ncbi:MAG: DUF2760 domain-containing protein [Myxococcales bacterium]|nr:DUF2760 domain-containing protein [Myxococcales bacterium]
MGRVGLAFRCFFRVLGGKPVPEEAIPEELRNPPKPQLPPAPEPPPEMSEEEKQARALALLAMLQKDGRLLDFLQENIDDYEDAQVGAAVRAIHRDCAKVLEESLKVEPVVDGEEDSDFTVEKGFDASRIRLIGNVTGDPPFKGVLRHHGWRATSLNVPDPAEKADASVIAPAEVELS